ncbi:Rab-GTPase-TBC domain, partial [Ostreococcus tauri]
RVVGVDVGGVDGGRFAARARRARADARTIDADVERSAQAYVADERELEALRVEIKAAIGGALGTEDGTERPRARYYQGLHDVAAVVALCDRRGRRGRASEGLSAAIMERLVLWHLRDHTREDLTSSMEMVSTWLDLLAKIDREVAKVLMATPPFYALKWFLCWFLHDVDDLVVAVRLVDAFIASHPWLPMYVAAALVMANADEIRKAGASGDDMDAVALLAKLSIANANDSTDAQLATVQKTLEAAFKLFERYPPNATFRPARNSAATRHPYPWESSATNAYGRAPLSVETVPHDRHRRWPLSTIDAAVFSARVKRLRDRGLLRRKQPLPVSTVSVDVHSLFAVLTFIVFVTLRQALARALGAVDLSYALGGSAAAATSAALGFVRLRSPRPVLPRRLPRP